jgi:phosphate starvation-inducible PhoH-like protein
MEEAFPPSVMGIVSMRNQQHRNGSAKGHRHQGTKGEQRESSRDRMSRNALERKARGAELQQSVVGLIPNVVHRELVYKTENQRLLGSSCRANVCTFATGPAGTGKTHIAIAEAIPHLKMHKDNILVLTNPATEIGEKLGTLPGDKDEKIAVSTRPLRDILLKLIGSSHLDYYVEAGKILFEPLGSILGTTFDNAVIVFDEAQNSTPQQMKALLTRVGQRSKIVIAGDYKEQKFIDGPSGLEDAIKRLEHLRDVGHIEFTPDDIVRSGFCKDVILAYRDNR